MRTIPSKLCPATPAIPAEVDLPRAGLFTPVSRDTLTKNKSTQSRTADKQR
jgi:hypothetical protein